MRGRLGIVMVIMAFNSPGIHARGIDGLEQVLRATERFSAAATYSVLMPQADEPVVYDIRLASDASEGDKYSPAAYLIDWSLQTADGVSQGFSCYFPGHFYNYRGERIREYHADWDSIPLTAGGGVQRNAQFAELLPQWLADQLRAIQADSTFTYDYTTGRAWRGRTVDMLEATQTIRGYDVKQIVMTFDPTTSLPLSITTDYNSGSIGEQTVSVEYVYGEDSDLPLTEEALAALYPDEFEKYRESNYSIETLPGRYLPGFALPTLTGERYQRDRADTFARPTAVVLIDPAQEASLQAVEALRRGVANAPRQVDILWVSVATNPDQAERAVGEAREGETLLLSGRTLARDCGAAVFPAAIFVNTDGKVAKVILGFNNDLAADVIQTIALLN